MTVVSGVILFISLVLLSWPFARTKMEKFIAVLLCGGIAALWAIFLEMGGIYLLV